MNKKKNIYNKAIIPSVIIAAVVAVAIALLLVKTKVLPKRADTTVPTESISETLPYTDEPSESYPDTTSESESTDATSESESQTEESTEPSDGENVWATAYVNIRTGPGTTYEKVGHLDIGDSVKRISDEGEWSKVWFNGKVCYVSNKYLTLRDLSYLSTTSAETTEGTKPSGNDETEKTTEGTTSGSNRNVVDPTKGNWNLVIVNAYNEYDSSYKPKLKEVCPGMGYDRYLDERAADHYTDMYNAAKKDGITLVPLSGYRSYALQERNWKARIQQEKNNGHSEAEAIKRASEVILPPGTSEHNLGIAMDICSLKDSFANTKEYKWLCAHAEDYGFILRYKSEWKSKTGIVPEPWHWRYVGVENAKKINASGLCLEDYVAQYA